MSEYKFEAVIMLPDGKSKTNVIYAEDIEQAQDIARMEAVDMKADSCYVLVDPEVLEGLKEDN